MANSPKVETREEARLLILQAIDDPEVDLISMANEVIESRNCCYLGKSFVDVTNRDESEVRVWVNKTCGMGNDDWFTIQPGNTERWRRCIGREVTVTLEHGNSLTFRVAIDSGSNSCSVVGGRLS